jgi:hypothetical protein
MDHVTIWSLQEKTQRSRPEHNQYVLLSFSYYIADNEHELRDKLDKHGMKMHIEPCAYRKMLRSFKVVVCDKLVDMAVLLGLINQLPYNDPEFPDNVK